VVRIAHSHHGHEGRQKGKLHADDNVINIRKFEPGRILKILQAKRTVLFKLLHNWSRASTLVPQLANMNSRQPIDITRQIAQPGQLARSDHGNRFRLLFCFLAVVLPALVRGVPGEQQRDRRHQGHHPYHDPRQRSIRQTPASRHRGRARCCQPRLRRGAAGSGFAGRLNAGLTMIGE
jgi:hypothetical protein